MRRFISRRHFLRTTGAVGAGIGLTRIGGAGLPTAKQAGAELSAENRDRYAAEDMCSLIEDCPNVGLGDSDPIRDLTAAFAKRDAMIADAEKWNAILDADPAQCAAMCITLPEGLAGVGVGDVACRIFIDGPYL